MFGRPACRDELEAWLPEAKKCADTLLGVADSNPYEVIAFRVRLLLHERVARDWWPELTPYLEDVLDQVRTPQDLSLYRALLPLRDVYKGHRDRDEVVKRHSQHEVLDREEDHLSLGIANGYWYDSFGCSD